MAPTIERGAVRLIYQTYGMANKGIQKKRYFGITIPPRTKRDRKNGYTIRFVLSGWIPSKKNLHKAVVERKDARRFLNKAFKGKIAVSFTRKACDELLSMTYGKIVNTEAYKDWEAQALKEIILQRDLIYSRHEEAKGLVLPIRDCSISVYSYWKDLHARDTINKMESVLDVLVKAGCIKDDDYFTLGPITGDAETVSKHVLKEHITTIDITVYPKHKVTAIIDELK